MNLSTLQAQERPADYLYSIAELCELSGFCAKTIRGWIRSGALPAARFGRDYRVRAADWRAFVAARRV